MKSIFGLLFFLSPLLAQDPLGFTLKDLSFEKNATTLSLGNFGGLNAPQFQEVDFSGDGHLDLVVLERIGNFVAYLEWDPLLADYKKVAGWSNALPVVQNWFKLLDYNCDGNVDLFASANGGIAVYRNIGNNTQPQFILEKELLYSTQNGNLINLFIFSSDIIAIEDIDGDQDLDILGFSLNNNEFVELHLNQSQEQGFNCDSLLFELSSECWGAFKEDGLNNDIALNEDCNAPPSVELRHAGSSLTLIDYNNDGAQDLLLGDVSFPELKLLLNSNTSLNAVMDSVVDTFPSQHPVELYNYPAAYLIDINHDNKKDLVVASANRSLYNNYEGIWYYENMASDGSYLFDFRKEALFQEDMIDLGEGAYVHAQDLNNDGLQDILLSVQNQSDGQGNSSYPITFYQNTGSADNPKFTWVSDDFANLSSFNLTGASQFTWGDLNNDGVLDLILGNIDGSLSYLINTNTNNSPSYSMAQQSVLDINNNPINLGQFASPLLIDLDLDNDLDLLIGNKTGTIAFYRNEGNNSNPNWKLENSTWENISTKNTFDLYGYATLDHYEHQGTSYLTLGSLSGDMDIYQINKGINPSLSPIDHELNNTFIGTRTKAVLRDFNNDGVLDAICSNYRGGITSFEGSLYSFIEDDKQITYSLYPNPSQQSLHLEFSETVSLELLIYDVRGELIFQATINDQKWSADLSFLSSGLYYIRMELKDQILQETWIKK